MARLATGPDVLDIGYAQQPNPWLRQFRTVGLDRSRPKKPSGYAEELQGDAMDLAPALGGRRFHTVVAGEVIEHLENPYAFLRGVSPFLRDGGRLLLSTPNPFGFPVFFFEAFRIRRFYYGQDHLYHYPPRWVERMLDRTGYELEAVRAVGLNLVVVALPCPVFLSYQLVFVARKRGGGAHA
jgi:SAM-dependent methyltransferase